MKYARFSSPKNPRPEPRVIGLEAHDLRHTAASLAVSAGANVKAIQRMLGHASAAMTLDVYSDLFDDDLDAVSTALDRARSVSNVGKPPFGEKQMPRVPCRHKGSRGIYSGGDGGI